MNWMLKLHEYYADMLADLYDSDPSLKLSFKNSIFAATTYNLGPQTTCFPHKNSANLTFGMCTIMALGDFDPKKGGHLVLWECRKVVEFPSGSSILIPSATITHSNVKVGKNEHQCSFTQYTAGGLFRWIENGFQMSEQLLDSLSAQEVAELKERNSERWLLGASKILRFIV